MLLRLAERLIDLPQAGAVLSASMLRNPKSAVLCSSTGAIRSPNLVRGRPPTLNLSPQKKTRGCTGFFWPPNISLRANFGVWPLMYISKANCSYNTCTHARRLPLAKPPPLNVCARHKWTVWRSGAFRLRFYEHSRTASSNNPHVSHGAAQTRITRFGDASLLVDRAAPPRSWREPRIGCQLAAIAEASGSGQLALSLLTKVHLAWGDRWFESISLQRRVRCEPDSEGTHPPAA